jgi:hypothetical protein
MRNSFRFVLLFLFVAPPPIRGAGNPLPAADNLDAPLPLFFRLVLVVHTPTTFSSPTA